MATAEVDEPDYFTSRELIADPYPYFDEVRAKCPVRTEPHHGVVMITGHAEVAAVLADTTTFSSCNAMSGPFPGFPVSLDGSDDVSDIIETYRHQLPMSDELTTMDPPRHTAHRAVVARYLTPKRVNAVEPSMRTLADRLIDGFVDQGRCEVISDFSGPFALLTICDFLGVPESDHEAFLVEMLNPRRPLLSGSAVGETPTDPFAFLHARFTTYLTERRAEPRDDVMSTVANTRFPDGAMPDLIEAVRLASMLFIAGIGTTAGLLATSMKLLTEHPELQARLRGDATLIPAFVEETLRLEGEVKATFRVARRATSVADVEIPAGSVVMLAVGAANHDPRKFDNPAQFDVDRPNARQHVAFGHGAHVCVGAPLARAEGRVGIERLLARLDNIALEENEHGPDGDRRFRYAPTYLTRSLQRLHIEFEELPLRSGMNNEE